MKKIALLGATGSVGKNTLEVIAAYPERFKLVAMSFHENISMGRSVIRAFNPLYVAAKDEAQRNTLRREFPEITFGIGLSGLTEAVTLSEVTTVVTAITGSVGLVPTLAAIDAKKEIALANKETLVMGGELVMKSAQENNVKILPVDSEHSAIFQCLEGQTKENIDHVVITASGGSFRDLTRDELSRVSVQEALAHPNWSMGRKITIDSATMMNKGLEVIEARWLFDLNYDKIKVVLHRESVVHSMVVLKDGAYLAQLGASDMREPIQYALTYPERLPIKNEKSFDLTVIGGLHFEKMDESRFPLLKLAYEVGRVGGTLPTVFNAANEIAVAAFLEGTISFLAIESYIEKLVEMHTSQKVESIEQLIEKDQLVRAQTIELIKKGLS